MNTTIINQAFESLNVRIVMQDDAPWFIAKDVATALGYKRPDQAVSKYCDDVMNLPLSLGGSLDSRLKVIPESDVYALIFGSKLESAKRFRKWVTKEVLPSIRKNGAFIVGVSDNKTVSSDLRDRLTRELVSKGKDLLSDIDRHARYGNLNPKRRANLADILSKRHGVPASLVEDMIVNGLSALELL
ncbi:hypothetical protein GMW71_10175 [Pectobacterium brasiliense]|nr:hypothetical protein GMW71_10175 [Pectobacterium brasiliense]